MDSIDELKIEYKRLQRHVHFLEKRFSPSVARDLAACLRNWVQMAETISNVIRDESWDIKFSKETIPKILKKIRSKGTNFNVPLPGVVKAGGIQISGVSIYDRALSPDEVKQSYEAGLSSRPSMQIMSFDDWLNNSAYRVHVKGVGKDIPRRNFIDRSANLLGGTHPMCNFVESEHSDWSDPYIIDSLSIQIGLWPMPYAILMETAQEIIRAFAVYLGPQK